MFLLLFLLFLSSACDVLKPVQTNPNHTDPDELPEIGNSTPDTTGKTVVVRPPSNETPTTPPTTNPKPPTNTGGKIIPTPDNEPKKGNTNPSLPTPTLPKGNLKGAYRVAVAMPLFAEEMNAAAATVPADSEQGMNFYEGILLALRQLSTENINLDVEIFDTRRSESVVMGLIDGGQLNNLDLIIGPAANENITLVSEKVSKQGVPMVSLNLNDNLVSENPYFIQASPYFATHAEAAISYAKKHFPNSRLLVVASDDAKEISRFQDYHQANTAVNQGLKPLREFVAEKQSSHVFTFTDLESQLSISDTTVVFVPSSNEYFVGSLFRKLSLTRNQRPVVVFGLPRWSSFDDMDYQYFQNLNVHLTNGSYINPQDDAIRQFDRAFFADYGALPSVEAYKGYDLMLFFGRMFQKHGTNFLNELSNEPETTLLHTKFAFQPIYTTDENGNLSIKFFENKYVNILKFDNFQFRRVAHPAQRTILFNKNKN